MRPECAGKHLRRGKSARYCDVLDRTLAVEQCVASGLETNLPVKSHCRFACVLPDDSTDRAHGQSDPQRQLAGGKRLAHVFFHVEENAGEHVARRWSAVRRIDALGMNALPYLRGDEAVGDDLCQRRVALHRCDQIEHQIEGGMPPAQLMRSRSMTNSRS